jgi:hypothetical protein
MKIDINREDDRLTVAAILVKNGYTVRQDKERRTPTARVNTYFIEAEKADEKEATR